MSNPQMLPERSTSFADQPHAYDPVAQPQLFAGVIRKRAAALSSMPSSSWCVFPFGIVTDLGWVLFASHSCQFFLSITR
jgi:hypothetical protein